MWWNIIKAPNHWPKPAKLFDERPNRVLGYVLSYYYLQNKEKVDNWVASRTDLDGIFIDVGDRSQTYNFSRGGFFIFNKSKLDGIVRDNKMLLNKHGITNTEELISNVATKKFDGEEMYNFIAGLFGDIRERAENPLKIHREERKFRQSQRGFE